jgi:membrane protease YdiL (CAAX protease family)
MRLTHGGCEESQNPATGAKLFLILFALYFVGKLCSIPILLETVPAQRWIATITIGVILAALLIRAGQSLSARTGMGLPFIEAWLAGRPVWDRLPRAAGLSVTISVLAALAALGVAFLTWSLEYGASGIGARLTEIATTYPAAWKWILASLDAGISEEIFYRYVLMSFVVWLVNRVRSGASGPPLRGAIWIGIVVSGVIFGWAHVDDRLAVTNSALTLLSIFAMTGGLGVVLGWLYRKYGLEIAMLTHFLMDAVYLAVLIPALLPG